jgi:hypothetical protein
VLTLENEDGFGAWSHTMMTRFQALRSNSTCAATKRVAEEAAQRVISHNGDTGSGSYSYMTPGTAVDPRKPTLKALSGTKCLELNIMICVQTLLSILYCGGTLWRQHRHRWGGNLKPVLKAPGACNPRL